MCIKYSLSKTIFVIKSKSLLFDIQHVFLKEQRSIKRILNLNQIYQNCELIYQHILRNNQRLIRNVEVNWFYLSSILFVNYKKELLNLSFLFTNICNIFNLTKCLNNCYLFQFNVFNLSLFPNQNKYTKKYQTIFAFFFISKAFLHKTFETICLLLFPIILYKIQEKIRYKSNILVQSFSYTNAYDLNCLYTKNQDKTQIRQLAHKHIKFDNKTKKLIQKHYPFDLFQKNHAFCLNHKFLAKTASFQNQIQIYNHIQRKNNIWNNNLLQVLTTRVFFNGNFVVNQYKSKFNSNYLFEELKVNKTDISISNLYSKLYKKQNKILFDKKHYNKQQFVSVFLNRISFFGFKKSIYNNIYMQWNIVTTHCKSIPNLLPNFVSETLRNFVQNNYINKQQAHKTYKTICNSYDPLQRILHKLIHNNLVENNKYVSFRILQLSQKILNYINFENWKITIFKTNNIFQPKKTFQVILANWYQKVNFQFFQLIQNWKKDNFALVGPKIAKMNASNFKRQTNDFQWFQTFQRYFTQIRLSKTIFNNLQVDAFQFPIHSKIEKVKRISWISVNKKYKERSDFVFLETNQNLSKNLLQRITNSQLTYRILDYIYESRNLKQPDYFQVVNKFSNVWVYNSKLSNLFNTNNSILETQVYFKYLKPFHDAWFQKFQFCQSFLFSLKKYQQQINCLFVSFIFKQQTSNIYKNKTLTKHLKNLFRIVSNLYEKYLPDSSIEKRSSCLQNSVLTSNFNNFNNEQDSINILPRNNSNQSVLFIPLYFQNENLSSRNYELTNWENNILSLNKKRFSFLFQSKVKYKSKLAKNQVSYFFTNWHINKYGHSFPISKFFEIYKPWFFTTQFFEIYKPWFFSTQSLIFLKNEAIKKHKAIINKFSNYHQKFLSLFPNLPNFLNNTNLNNESFESLFLNIGNLINSTKINVFFWDQIQNNTYIWKDLWNSVVFKSYFTNEQILLLMWFSSIFFIYYHCFSTVLGSSYLSLWLNFEYNRYLLNPPKNIYKLVHLIKKPISLQSNLELNENRLIANIIRIPFFLLKNFIINIFTHHFFVNQITFDIFQTKKKNVVQFLISQSTLFEEIPFITKIKEVGFPFKNTLKNNENYFILLNQSFFFSNNQKLFNKNISFHSKHLLYLFYSTNIFNSNFLFQTKQNLKYPFCKPSELSHSSISLELEYLLPRAILVLGAKDTGKSYLIKKLASNITTSFIHICKQNLLSIKIRKEKEGGKQYIRRIKNKILKRIDFIFHLSTIVNPSIVWISSIHEFCTPFVFQKTSIENRFLLCSLISTISSSSNVHLKSKTMFIGSTDNCEQLDPSFLGLNIFHKLIHVRIPTSIQRVKNLATELQNQQNIFNNKFFHIKIETNTMIYTFKDVQGLANEILLINKIQNQQNLNPFTIDLAVYRHLYGIKNISIFESESIAYKIGNMFLSYILMNSVSKIQGDVWKTRFYYLSKMCIELPIAKSTITEFFILSSIFKYLAGSSFRNIWLFSFQIIQNHMFDLKKEIDHDMQITSDLLGYFSQKIITSDIFTTQYQKFVSFVHYERTYDLNILNKIAFKLDNFKNISGQIVDTEFFNNSFLFTNCHKLNSGNLSNNFQKSNRLFYFDFWMNKSLFNKSHIKSTQKDTLKNFLFVSVFKQNENKSKSFVPNMVLSKKEPYKKRKKNPIFDKQLQMRNKFFEENEIQELLDFQNTYIINDNYFYFFLNRIKIESKKTIPLYLPEYLFENFIQKDETKNTFQSLNFIYFKYQYQVKNTAINIDSTKNLHAVVSEIYYYLLKIILY